MAKIKLYAHDDFKGVNLEKSSNDSNFYDDGFNDQISSVIVESGTWQIYEHSNFTGRSVTLSYQGGPDGNGQYPNPSCMGGFNDSFSSIRLVHQ